MGNLIKKAQKQVITYWPPLQSNSHGEPVWGTAVQYTARIDAKIMQIIGASDTMVLSRHQLITQVLLATGGIVVFSPLASVTYTTAPKSNPGAYEILAVASTPDLRNRYTLFEAYC